MSSQTAPMTTRPVITDFHWSGTPATDRPMRRVLMRKAPMTVPTMLPSPPDRDVPPMTAAAMASSS